MPFKIQYRYRPQEYGEQLVRMYLLTNNKESKLGTSPLPDGVVRVFRENGRDGLSYLTQQAVKYIPIGDKIELNLGPDPEVIFEWLKLKTHRGDIWFQVNGVNVFHKLDEQGFRAEPNMTVVGWDDHETYSQRVRNYTAKPIELEIRRPLAGPRRLPQPARSDALRLSDGRVQNDRAGGQARRSDARDHPPPRTKRQAEQRDARSGRRKRQVAWASAHVG